MNYAYNWIQRPFGTITHYIHLWASDCLFLVFSICRCFLINLCDFQNHNQLHRWINAIHFLFTQAIQYYIAYSWHRNRFSQSNHRAIHHTNFDNISLAYGIVSLLFLCPVCALPSPKHFNVNPLEPLNFYCRKM